MTDPDPRALVAEHLDAVWARAAGGAQPLEVVVGAFRSVLAAPGTASPRSALLAATDRLARRGAVSGITDLGATAQPRPEPELVLRRVVDPEDPAPTVAPGRLPRRSRRRLVLALGVVALLVGGGAVVLQQRPSDGPPAAGATATAAPATVPPLVVAADRADTAARAASARLSARSGVPTSGDLLLDQHLARCAAAVDGSELRSRYPAPESWAVTSSQVGRTGVATAVSDRFFCSTTPRTTSISATALPGGEPGFVQVGAYELGLLNPSRRPVRVSVDGADADLRGTAVLLGVTQRSRVVAAVGSGSGPSAVTPAPTAITVNDQEVPAQDRRSPANLHLDDCLSGPTGVLVPDRETWRTADATVPGAILARAPGMAGLCVDGPDGNPAVMTVAPVADPAPDAALTIVTTLGAVGGGPSSYVLVSLDPRTTRLFASRGGTPLSCAVANGLGLCGGSAATPGLTRLTGLGPDGDVVAGPVQQ